MHGVSAEETASTPEAWFCFVQTATIWAQCGGKFGGVRCMAKPDGSARCGDAAWRLALRILGLQGPAMPSFDCAVFRRLGKLLRLPRGANDFNNTWLLACSWVKCPAASACERLNWGFWQCRPN